MNIFKFLGLILVFALILSNSSLALADEGWDYMGSDLRVDLAEVNSARDYQVCINAVNLRSAASRPQTHNPFIQLAE